MAVTGHRDFCLEVSKKLLVPRCLQDPLRWVQIAKDSFQDSPRSGLTQVFGVNTTSQQSSDFFNDLLQIYMGRIRRRIHHFMRQASCDEERGWWLKIKNELLDTAEGAQFSCCENILSTSLARRVLPYMLNENMLSHGQLPTTQLKAREKKKNTLRPHAIVNAAG